MEDKDWKIKKCKECRDLIVNASEESEEKGVCKECYEEMSEFYEYMI